MGYYCPRANTDPKELMKNTPRERVTPTPPEAPNGIKLVKNALCPELDKFGKRAICKEGLCCGMSSSTSDTSKTIDHCRHKDVASYISDDGEKYNFECYDDSRALIVSLSAILITLFLTNI